ncbi:Purine-cytosine permease FCY21 [Fusarium odoratissimum]|uniref:Purine-cytosine permease FCY21 n=1 Tax=Fusarium oxysporum f. sp. cubense (strain race 4) TaxID=2502994 RepID=N1S517_FUSC4|nr:Purine-cytosine permease FCY21 [Fusarium odoratissimum]
MAANLEEHHLPNRLDGQKHESSEMSKDIDTELGVERKKDAVSIPGTSEPVNSFWQKLVNLGVELQGLEPILLELRITSIFSHYSQKRPWGFFRKYYLSPQNMQYLADMTALGLQDWYRGRHDAWVRAVASAGSSNDYLPTADSSHTVLLHPHPRTAPRYETVVRYFNQVISFVGLVGTAIFGIVASVTGGQTLASVNPRTLSIEGGITIILLTACFIGFMGYKVLHGFARYVWIPAAFGVVILIGCAGDQLHQQAPSRATGARPWLSLISLTAGISFAWGGIIGGYACYMLMKAPRFRLAFYFLSGFGVIFSLLMILGAALGGAALMIPNWATALERGGTGAVVGEILISRLGGFGRFVLTILALTVVITSARYIYSISLPAQAVVPCLERVHRAILALITTGVLIGVAIPASKSFISSLSPLVSILSYTSGTTVTAFLIEWLWFRRADPDSMDPAIWDDGKALPSGIPAIATFVSAWGPIICGMGTVWLRGPLAKAVGDLGSELAIVTAIVIYIPLRTLEIKYSGRF